MVDNNQSTIPPARPNPPSRSRSSMAVTVQRIAQRVLESPEPWLVVLPLIEPFPINRLAHLLRACRAYAALGLVELNARRLELQAAEVENPPHAAFEIIDHVLMLDSKDPSWKHRIPVPHQLEIGSVIPRDVFDAVGKLLSVGKQLL